MASTKWILGILGVAGVTTAGVYLTNLMNFSKKAVIEQTTSFSTSGNTSLPSWASSILSSFNVKIPEKIILTINVLVKNPTNVTLTISQPFVQLWLQPDKTKAAFVSSSQQNIHHTIPKLGEKAFDPIVLTIPVSSIVSALPDLFRQLVKEKKITIYTRIASFVDKKIPTVKDDEQTFSI